MKKLLLISISIFLSNIVLAQESNWIDSILNKIILNKIEVFDTEFNLIKNSTIELITTDTVVNDQWTRPKFVDNIFHSPIDGVIFEDKINFDTSTNKTNPNYLNFTIEQFNENNEYLKDSIIFLINKINSIDGNLNKDLELAKNLKNTIWKNEEIELDSKEIEMDSCHKIFKLQLNEDYTFYQFYGDNQSSCSTQEMKEEKEVGVEGNSEEFFKYQNKIQGHFLSLQQGNWLVNKNELQLIDLQKKKKLIFEIRKLNNEKLYLKFKGMNYLIKMKKISY